MRRRRGENFYCLSFTKAYVFGKEAVQPRRASREDVKEALKNTIPIVQYKKLCKKERMFDWVRSVKQEIIPFCLIFPVICDQRIPLMH